MLDCAVLLKEIVLLRSLDPTEGVELDLPAFVPVVVGWNDDVDVIEPALECLTELTVGWLVDLKIVEVFDKCLLWDDSVAVEDASLVCLFERTVWVLELITDNDERCALEVALICPVDPMAEGADDWNAEDAFNVDTRTEDPCLDERTLPDTEARVWLWREWIDREDPTVGDNDPRERRTEDAKSDFVDWPDAMVDERNKLEVIPELNDVRYTEGERLNLELG